MECSDIEDWVRLRASANRGRPKLRAVSPCQRVYQHDFHFSAENSNISMSWNLPVRTRTEPMTGVRALGLRVAGLGGR